MKKPVCAAIVLIIALCWAVPALAGTATSININPDIIEIGSTFNGTQMEISGSVPEGSDVYVKIASPNDSVIELNKKGKVGLFWMNVESSVIKNVPKLYKIMSSAPLQKLSPELLKETGLNTDFSAAFAEAEAVRHSDSGVTRISREAAVDYFSAMTDIYRKGRLYDIEENAVTVSGGKYKGSIFLPPNIPQEKCNVTVYAVKNGQIISSVTTPFRVTGVGMVRWLSREAIYSGPEYGFMAVIIALLFGAGVALLFSYLEGLISGKKAGFSAGGGH